jgi:16S rRNA (cytosine967-C5)-methyltransferase
LLRRPADIGTLVALQSQMLDALWKTLKPGGRMLYATCSILPQENAQQVSAFLSKQADARVIPIEIGCGKAVEIGHQLLPQPGGHDGFYYALLEKC